MQLLRDKGHAGPISKDEATKAAIAEARGKPLLPPEVKEGRPTKDNPKSVDNINTSKGGTGTDYTLRRLARDCPEMLDKIEAGELSVNAAAIQAGIRKKPSQAEIKLRAERKAGEMLAEMDKHEGGRPPKTGNIMLPVSLDALGITKMQSSRCD